MSEATEVPDASGLIAAAEETSLLDTELTVIILLTVGAAVAVIARRVRLPFTVALVVVGLGFALFPDFIELDVSPDLILGLLVPPLVFQATLYLPWRSLRADLFPVLALAVGGTLLGALLVAGIVEPFADISWLAALTFGALISATDPVAVVAFFRSFGVDKRLAVLVEGESLFNDGVAIVLFNLALGAAVAGEDLTLGGAIGDFVLMGLGGLAVGAVLGYVVSVIVLKGLDDHLIETAVTLALAYGSFLVAQQFGLILGFDDDFHLSGILAVVAAGLFVGNVGLANTAPTTRLTIENFWELLAFLANTLVFLLVGIQIDVTELRPRLGDVAIAVVAILVSRAVIVYGFGWAHARLRGVRPIPMTFRHVMFWGGLRGAVSLALLLSVTQQAAFDPRTIEVLRVMTFGVVLFTLLVQGTTIARLIRGLGLVEHDEADRALAGHRARLYARRAGQREVERLERDGIVAPDVADSMRQVYEEEIRLTAGDVTKQAREHPELQIAALLHTRRSALAAEKRALIDLSRRGLVGGEVIDGLVAAVDDRVVALDLLEERWDRRPPEGLEP
jgi:CPA1 family monovalent cation:H+ antiporter